MKFELDIELNPTLVEIIQELGTSDLIETNLVDHLIEFLTIKIKELNQAFLKGQDKFLEKQIVNEAFEPEKSDINIKQEGIIYERENLLRLFRDLENFKQNRLVQADFMRHKSEFLGINPNEIEEMNNTIKNTIKKELDEIEIKSQEIKIEGKKLLKWTLEELKEYCDIFEIQMTSKIKKEEIIKNILEYQDKITARAPEGRILPSITTNDVRSVISKEWQDIRSVITRLKIKDMMDARFLQIKLNQLVKKGILLEEIKNEKKYWKLK